MPIQDKGWSCEKKLKGKNFLMGGRGENFDYENNPNFFFNIWNIIFHFQLYFLIFTQNMHFRMSNSLIYGGERG